MLDCGGRADNPDATNQRGPCPAGARQQRARGMAGLRVSLRGHTAPGLARSVERDRGDS